MVFFVFLFDRLLKLYAQLIFLRRESDLLTEYTVKACLGDKSAFACDLGIIFIGRAKQGLCLFNTKGIDKRAEAEARQRLKAAGDVFRIVAERRSDRLKTYFLIVIFTYVNKDF